jgi:effector-binding domain-containing protein
MEHEVKLGQREAALVLAKRLPVRLSQIGNVMGGAFGEVYGYLGAQGVEGQGPPFVVYHGAPVEDDPFDIEVCAPVTAPIDPPAGWQLEELPAGTFATLLHVGPYDAIGASYEAMFAWVGAHGLAPAGPPREVYLSEPGTPPDQIRTIVELPVTESAAPVVTS